MPDALRTTLVAVSGGADSAALAIALATLSGSRIVLGLVLHDQRPAELIHDDRVAVGTLASRLGVRVVTDHARGGEGNAEHAARSARYARLDRMARSLGCRFIATAHHAYDQTETLLLAMVRGGSPEALIGIHRSRRYSDASAVQIIRPALKLMPQGAARVCEEHGYTPRLDATNRDPARARARLRHTVAPQLAHATPNLGEMLARTVSRLERRLSELPVEQGSDVGLEGLDA